MSIQDTFEFDKSGEVVERPWLKRFFLTFVIILVAILAFGVGRLSGESREGGVKIESQHIDQDNASTSADSTSRTQAAATIFASSKGTKYYYPGCPNTISDKNKVTFTSVSEAEAAGYTLATNCTPH